MKSIVATLVVAAVIGTSLPACNVIRGQSTAGEYVDDVTVTTKVKAQLLDSKNVEGLDVNVNVNQGRVVLTGWADSQTERTRATQVAAAVEGVRSVDNQLKIKEQ